MLHFFLSLLIISSPLFIEGTSGYKFIELDTYMYGSSYANAINDRGQVAGGFAVEDDQFVFVWSPDSGVQVLGIPFNANVRKINNAGQVAGEYFIQKGIGKNKKHILCAYLWDPTTGFIDLGSIGDHDTYVQSLNDQGEVLVSANGHAYLVQGFQVRPLTKIEGIEFDTYSTNFFLRMNQNKQMAYSNTTEQGEVQVNSIVWEDVSANSYQGHSINAYITDLNNVGTASGFLVLLNKIKGFLWKPGRDMKFIEDFAPEAINDHHHAVGSIIKAHEVICPAGLWKDGKTIDLNKKMHFNEDSEECQGILALNDINNHGSIVGIGMRNGFPHAILLVSDEEK